MALGTRTDPYAPLLNWGALPTRNKRPARKHPAGSTRRGWSNFQTKLDPAIKFPDLGLSMIMTILWLIRGR